MWATAARHDFSELYDYCVKEPQIQTEILQTLRDPNKGLRYFQDDCHLSFNSLHNLVSRVISAVVEHARPIFDTTGTEGEKGRVKWDFTTPKTSETSAFEKLASQTSPFTGKSPAKREIPSFTFNR